MGFDGLEFGEGLLLSGIKGDLFASGGSSHSGRFFATIFLDAEGEKKIGGFGDWI